MTSVSSVIIQICPCTHMHSHIWYDWLQIADPYRWLEDPDSEGTKKFVRQQNELSKPYLETCKIRPQIIERYAVLVAVSLVMHAVCSGPVSGQYPYYGSVWVLFPWFDARWFCLFLFLSIIFFSFFCFVLGLFVVVQCCCFFVGGWGGGGGGGGGGAERVRETDTDRDIWL